MKSKEEIRAAWLCTALMLFLQVDPGVGETTVPQASMPIPWSEIGTKAGADYKGEGLSVEPTESGARLRCVFQQLEGEATSEGLWLRSTVTNVASERFRVKATSVGRKAEAMEALSRTGSASSDGQTVRFIRPGLVEEYSVSINGVRQDFVIEQKPSGGSDLRVGLAVTGGKVVGVGDGAQLVVEKSGRKIAYSRLRVTDATGMELSARMEVLADGARRSRRFDAKDSAGAGNSFDAREMSTVNRPEDRAPALAIVVEDAPAAYPIRIDPTFSDANWISMNPSIPGAGGSVYAAVVDGSSNLYIGGRFSAVGGMIASHIAKWNGSSWSALGSGMETRFGTPAVLALAVSGSILYAAGFFTTAGGITASNIAQWNGSSWSALGSGTSGNVSGLAVSGSNLYAGGSFTRAGGVSANFIAQWNGSSWSALGSGMNRSVYALAVSGSDLYAGGEFTNAGGIRANSIAKWDGSAWSALGSGMGGGDLFFPFPLVQALAVSGSDLYAGGNFTNAGGVSASNIAKWNGSSWSALGSGMNNAVRALAVSGSNLYAGGSFTRAGGVSANRIAQWNGSSWSALGSGMNDAVEALVVSGTDVYAGGLFTTADGTAANRIAKWNGSSWSALGSGSTMNDVVRALAASGSDLYAGGNFTTAGGISASYIAKWNGSSWSALGSGVNGEVRALAVSCNDLHAGGYFQTAGGNAAEYIAKWNGSSWSALGSGMNYLVLALVVSGTDVYAGGSFTTAGSTAASRIAKWNGSSWSALGSGIGGAPPGREAAVYALAVSGSNLYAGGFFTNAGGTAVKYIAKWNEDRWMAMGSGIVGEVWALATSGSDLYAGGYFTTAGGNAGNNIAKWNGSSWSALGSGMNDGVIALAVSGSDLYAGGYFTTAGAKVSGYTARARIGSIATSLVATNSAAAIEFSGVTGSEYDVQRATSLEPPITWNTVSTGPLSPAEDGSFTFTDTNAPPGTAYYRAVER